MRIRRRKREWKEGKKKSRDASSLVELVEALLGGPCAPDGNHETFGVKLLMERGGRGCVRAGRIEIFFFSFSLSGLRDGRWMMELERGRG